MQSRSGGVLIRQDDRAIFCEWPGARGVIGDLHAVAVAVQMVLVWRVGGADSLGCRGGHLL